MSITPRKKRIFLVDDHPLVREWLTTLIQQQPDLAICGGAESASLAISALATAQADLLVADLNLKESSGLDLIKQLKELHPALPVLVLSMHDESLYAERAFRAGARGYVNKRETAENVIEAIRKVLSGKLFVSEKTAEILASQALRGQNASKSMIELLSDRELEVFEKLGNGQGTKQIAEDLRVSIKTVQEYCSRIKEKLHLNNATELLREAMRWQESKKSN